MSEMIGNYYEDDGESLGFALPTGFDARRGPRFAAAASVAAHTAAGRAAVPGNATAAATALIMKIRASFKNRTAHPDTMAIAQALEAHNVGGSMNEASKRQWFSYFLSMTAGAPSGSDLQVYFATVAAVLAA